MNRHLFRNVAIPVVSLAVLGTVGYLAYRQVAHNSGTPGVTVRESLPDEQSGTFPADLPLGADAELLGTELATAGDGRVQETRTYRVDRPLGQVGADFEAYFASGWDFQDRTELASFVAYLAERGTISLQVTLNANEDSSTSASVSASAAPARLDATI